MGECLIIRSGGGTDTSGATATASVVLAGYTCYVNDNKITGSMPAQTLNRTLNAGGSVTIPAGYYNGSSVISTSTLAGETAANAASSHILSGYNAWVNGSNTWGNMPNRGNISHSLPANGTYTVPAGWHAGGGVVNQSLAFHWGGTYTPNTANQVICWANWYAAGNIVVLGSSALTAGNIKNGVWIFGVLGTFYGWADDTVILYNHGSSFNSVYWLCYYGGMDWDGAGEYNSSGYYPCFTTANWTPTLSLLRQIEGRYEGSGHWRISHLRLWFRDQAGKIPSNNTIVPYFYWTNISTSSGTIDSNKLIFTVIYGGSTKSVAEIQADWDYAMSTRNGNFRWDRKMGNVEETWNYTRTGMVTWRTTRELPVRHGWDESLSSGGNAWKYTSYRWTGEVDIFAEYGDSHSSHKMHIGRIDYHPAK